MINKSVFIANHIKICKASLAKKYDPKKNGKGYHTLVYSRNKCAKSLWRKKQRFAKLTKISY